MASIDLHAKTIANNITMTVRFREGRQWAWRLKLGSWLIRLAAWVMWVNVELEGFE